jgi:hypothetical protein
MQEKYCRARRATDDNKIQNTENWILVAGNYGNYTDTHSQRLILIVVRVVRNIL